MDIRGSRQALRDQGRAARIGHGPEHRRRGRAERGDLERRGIGERKSRELTGITVRPLAVQ